MSQFPDTSLDLHMTSSAENVRNELRWEVQDAKGQQLVLAQLRPELAIDQALRRRYVYEAERLAAIQTPFLAKTIAIGPTPDPRAHDAIAPWRLRIAPPGTSLDSWLNKRQTVSIEQCFTLLSGLAEAVHGIHSKGLVLRDLEPKNIVVDDALNATITDIGLARVDILSSRSASSLLLESSAYAAPEHLRTTLVDGRADIYTIAAIAWEALTGVLPYDGDSSFLRNYNNLEDVRSLRPDIPDGLATLVHSCLSESPAARPNSLQDVIDILKGDIAANPNALQYLNCQACGQKLRVGLRLCLNCGKTAVQYYSAPDDAPHSYTLVLKKASEKQSFHTRLQRFFADIGDGEIPKLNFLVEAPGLYSKSERKRYTPLPVALLTGLEKTSADALKERLSKEGFAIKLRKDKNPVVQTKWGTRLRWLGWGSAVAGTGAVIATQAMTFIPFAVVIGAVIIASVGTSQKARAQKTLKPGLSQLRLTASASDTSDPHIAQLAKLLRAPLSEDIKNQVSELALVVQRLYSDAAQSESAADALSMVQKPVEQLIELICNEVGTLRSIDTALTTLDEGSLVRAISASIARDESPERRRDFLLGLDQLRKLEDQRSGHMATLLEASALLRRACRLD